MHYELGNEDVLPNLCKSTYRYFEKKGELRQAEKSILNFFSNTILKITTGRGKRNAFIELKKELESVMSGEMLDDFDFISWIDSKIQNKSFLEVVRSRQRASARERIRPFGEDSQGKKKAKSSLQSAMTGG